MAKGKVEVLEEYCKGCGLCVAVCPTGVLQVSRELSALGVNPARPRPEHDCRLCGRCTAMCLSLIHI